jgi:hypothetical protein
MKNNRLIHIYLKKSKDSCSLPVPFKYIQGEPAHLLRALFSILTLKYSTQTIEKAGQVHYIESAR